MFLCIYTDKRNRLSQIEDVALSSSENFNRNFNDLTFDLFVLLAYVALETELLVSTRPVKLLG